MINVKVITSTKSQKIANVTDTIRSVLEWAGVADANNDVTLKFQPISPDHYEMTFEDFGIRDDESVTITSIPRKANA